MNNIDLKNRSRLKETEDFWQALYLSQLRFPGFTLELLNEYYNICEIRSIDENPKHQENIEKQLIMKHILERYRLDLTDTQKSDANSIDKNLEQENSVLQSIDWLSEAVLFHRDLTKLNSKYLDEKFREKFEFARKKSISKEELDESIKTEIQSGHDDKIGDLNANRLKSLFLLIMGMAIERYEYRGDPKNKGEDGRSHASRYIASSISLIGQELSSETVRDILHNAWDHLNLDTSILPPSKKR